MKWSWVISEVRIDRQKTSRCMLWSLSDTVDGSEIRRSPVEVGRKLPWFTGGLIDLTWCRGSANSILPLDSCRFIRKLIKQKIRFVQINCWIIINRLITTVFFFLFFFGGGGGWDWFNSSLFCHCYTRWFERCFIFTWILWEMIQVDQLWYISNGWFNQQVV